MVKFLLILAYTFNIWLAFILTIGDVILDPTILLTFDYWFEFGTTLALGYSTMIILIVLGMETMKFGNKNLLDKDGVKIETPYEYMMGSLFQVNNKIKKERLSNDLGIQVEYDNGLVKANAYLVKCDKKRKNKPLDHFWVNEYDNTVLYIKAYKANDLEGLYELQSNGYNMDSKKVRYKKIKEGSLLNGNTSSSDDEDMSINVALYVVDKKLPFLLVSFLISIVGTVVISEVLDWSNWTELVAKLFVIGWNSMVGFMLGKDIVENYLITQLNKVRIYLQKFYDKASKLKGEM